MAKKNQRIGGRGCPSCGSHDTEGLTNSGAQWCMTCNHRWVPCARHCRGYSIEYDHPDGPKIRGCKECGVPDKIARWWPEAYRMIGVELGKHKDKLKSVLD